MPVPGPIMIIGTLPVVIAIAANLLNHQRDGRFPWLKLAPPLALILLGIACVNHVEWAALLQNPQADTGRYITGAVLAEHAAHPPLGYIQHVPDMIDAAPAPCRA